MRIDVSTQGVRHTRELREHVGRRIHFALGRFVHRISRVRVRIVDVNGPRGGIDTRCVIQVKLPRMSPVIVDETNRDAQAAVDIASERVGRSVSRRIERWLSLRRRTPSRAA